MITKVQGKTVSGELSVKACPRLNPLEKAMLRWAVVDPEDRVLDACVGRGLMAEYLRRNMQCEVCGVSSDMEEVRSARARLQSCDIVYAPVGDIPWREGAFDTVLMQWKGDADSLDRMLGEVLRVLKPGGLFITEQIGQRDNRALSRRLLPEYEPPFPGHCLKNAAEAFRGYGFNILYGQEYFPKLRFNDVGALAYFAHIVGWEFPGFSVDRCRRELLALNEEVQEMGFIESLQHRFILVAQKIQTR